ncbi:MAG TPA: pyruvate, phosphate dikinase, partial [Erysipelothrix sp.]|nr:pyruvate, phosphate dikinase [Erysipelothrix sp.]
MGNKLVYLFSEGNGQMRELLGGKGANLSEMTNLGLPVPQGFIVTTEACNDYYAQDGNISEDLRNQVAEYIKKLEEITGKVFGDTNNPLLVSVRSGSRASMPGMMDTVLNLGLNDVVVEALAKLTNNPRFAYDSYRRFIQMFADVVMEIPKHHFEVIIDEMKAERNITDDADFTADDYKEMVERFKAYYLEHHHESFPTEPFDQLMESITAV